MADPVCPDCSDTGLIANRWGAFCWCTAGRELKSGIAEAVGEDAAKAQAGQLPLFGGSDE